MKFKIKASTYAEFVSKVKAKAVGGSLAFHKSVSDSVTFTDKEGKRHRFVWVKTEDRVGLTKKSAPTTEVSKGLAIGAATVLYLSAIAWVAVKLYFLASASLNGLNNQ